MDARMNDLENAVKKHVNDALDQKLDEIKRLIDTELGSSTLLSRGLIKSVQNLAPNILELRKD